MTRSTWLICALLTGAALVASGWVYVNRQVWLPDVVPVHWGIDFQPDAWVSRDGIFWYLMIPPLAMAALAVLLPVLIFWLSPRGFEPGKENPRVVNYILVLVIGLMAAIHAVLLLAYAGNGFSLMDAMMGVLFLFFLLLGNVLGKVQRNFWIGIRTPWTLASHLVWEKTHRVGAWLFVATGLLGLLSLFASRLLPQMAMLILWGVLVFGSAIATVVYSLVLYKQLERQGRLAE
jgi:uncharacterized membrane protein